MPNFKPNLLTLALMASGLSFTGASAYAQDAAASTEADNQEEAIEVVTVTGIRGGLQRAQAVKMDSSSIVEAISAEDIGKLPDASIAESLARLPGLTAQRLDGRANVISIRGLSPDFTTATLNGREQVTVGDNRGVEFDQYPSELLSGAVVYKTPDAKLSSQAIGGTIDMQTIRPLSHGEQSFAIGARYEKNDMDAVNPDGDDTGNRLSFSYIDQFADDTIGIAFGFAHMDSPNQEERWESWGFPDAADGNLVIGGAKPYVRSSTLERDGFMGVFEYRPNDKLHTVVDAYYSDFKDTQILRGIELPLAWSGAQLDPNYVAEDGLITSGQFNGVMAQMRNDLNIRDAEVTSIGWNTEYVFSDYWRVEADVAYSKAERSDFGLESYAGTGRGNANGATDDIAFQMQNEGGIMFTPGLNYADPSLFMIGGALDWGNGVTVPKNAQDGFINTPEIEDELTTLKLSAERFIDNSWVTSIEFGLEYSEREKSKEDNGYFLTLNGYPDILAVPDEYMLSPTSLEFIGMGNMLSYDSYRFYKDGNYIETHENDTVVSRSTGTWTVNEDVTAGYVMANIDTEVSDLPLSGNMGVRVVYTDQYSNGLAATTNDGLVEVLPVSEGTDYTEILPSLNLNLELSDEQMLRFGVARTLARARLDQMNASRTFSYDPNLENSTDINNSPWSAKSGNPHLEPWKAWQFDLSYEYYFGETGYVAVAGFYKDLQDYIFESFVVQDFSNVEPPPGQDPVLTEGLLEIPQNGDDGEIHGIEVTLSVTGDMVSDYLEGFGLIVSGSITDSEVKETPDSDPIDLPGLSKKVLNTTLYYENSGFEARVSSRYRSDFLGETTGLSLARELVNVQSELVVDAQVAYDFSESQWEDLDGLTIMFQVTNLTDEPFSTYHAGDERQVKDYQVYGRNYMIGANYKF